MRLGLHVGPLATGTQELLELVREVDRLGFHSVWTSEAWGGDAVSMAAWLAGQTRRIRLGTAVMQIPARTPAMAAMTAASLDILSGGRFLLGLGVSGPQVVEGWHGVPFGRPLQRAREYVGVIRKALARTEPLRFQGEYYSLPVAGGTGLGKPLKLAIRPLRDPLPIYLAAIGPANVSLAAEIAEGWLPIFYSFRHFRLFESRLEEGFRRSGGMEKRERFDVAPLVPVVMGEDLQACRMEVKRSLSFYVGGMGSLKKNFYNDLVRRYGYEEAARDIQSQFLEGRRIEAAQSVPDELVDEVALCGPRERIAELLPEWEQAGVGTLICMTQDAGTCRQLAELVL